MKVYFFIQKHTINWVKIMLINYLKSSAWTIGIILTSIIIVTILNYFNILNGTILKIVELLIPIIAIFIGSYKIGKASTKKGYIEGIKYGIIWIVVFLIINLFLKSLSLRNSIYFLLLMLDSTLASMVGINRRKN